LGGVIDQRLGRTHAQVVQVLYGSDRGDLLGRAHLLDRDLGQTYVPDLALLLQHGQRAELVGQRHQRVDVVELEQVEALHAQVAQALLDADGHVVAAARGPGLYAAVQDAGHRAGPGRDHEVLGIRVQRLPDQKVRIERSARVRRINQRDAQLNTAAEQ